MPNLGYEKIESRWIDHPDIRNLVRELCVGEVLNFPCGASGLGDTHADIDPENNPDVIADLKNNPFPENSFDTVYCDPPYSMISSFSGSLGWIQDLFEVASDRLIVQGLNKALYPGGVYDQDVYCLVPKPGSTKNWIRVIQVFYHPQTTVNDF